MSENQAAAPAAQEAPATVEQVLDEATTVPESEAQEAAPSEAPKKEAKPSAKEVKEASAIQDKKDSGAKLSKSEEKQLKEFKLKVNGRDKTVKLDLSNEAELQKHLQKAFAADEAFQQSALVQKAAQTFLNDIKTNPRKVLQDPNIGVDIYKLAEEIMNERVQELQKSPEQREKEAREKELVDLKKKIDDQQKQFEEKESSRIAQEHERALENEISAALDVGGLPKTPRTVARMAEMMGIALKYGVEISPQEVAPIVKRMNSDEFQEVLDGLSDDQLEDFIGKKVIGRLRKKNVAKVKTPTPAAKVADTGADVSQKSPAEPAKKITLRDWLKV